MAPSSRFAVVAEAERRVPRVELLRALEEADDLAVLGIRGHPVPGFRREGWRAGFDDRMEPLGHGAIRFRHLGDLREHGAFPVRLVLARARFRLQLLGALLHRGSFLVRESLGRLAGGALADFCVPFFADFLSAILPSSDRTTDMVGACPVVASPELLEPVATTRDRAHAGDAWRRSRVRPSRSIVSGGGGTRWPPGDDRRPSSAECSSVSAGLCRASRGRRYGLAYQGAGGRWHARSPPRCRASRRRVG